MSSIVEQNIETVIHVAYVAWIFHHFIRQIRLFLAFFPSTLCRASVRLRECFNYWRGSCRWNFIRIHTLSLRSPIRSQRVTLLSFRGRRELQRHVRSNESHNIYTSLLSQVTVLILWGDMVTHEQLIRVRFALIYYGALSHGRELACKPMVHIEDIGIPVVGHLDKINTAIKRNAIKM